MVLIARSGRQIEFAAGVLYEKAHVPPSNDLRALFWVDQNSIIGWVVGFTGWIGKTVQMHVANISTTRYLPRALRDASFDWAFNYHNLDLVFVVVNSLNDASMNLTERLGYKEKTRWEDMHDDGGDLVLKEMYKKDCRWIKH